MGIPQQQQVALVRSEMKLSLLLLTVFIISKCTSGRSISMTEEKFGRGDFPEGISPPIRRRRDVDFRKLYRAILADKTRQDEWKEIVREMNGEVYRKKVLVEGRFEGWG